MSEKTENLKKLAEWLFPDDVWTDHGHCVRHHPIVEDGEVVWSMRRDVRFDPANIPAQHLKLQKKYGEWLFENDGTINAWSAATRDWDSLEYAIVRDVFK